MILTQGAQWVDGNESKCRHLLSNFCSRSTYNWILYPFHLTEVVVLTQVYPNSCTCLLVNYTLFLLTSHRNNTINIFCIGQYYTSHFYILFISKLFSSLGTVHSLFFLPENLLVLETNIQANLQNENTNFDDTNFKIDVYIRHI